MNFTTLTWLRNLKLNKSINTNLRKITTSLIPFKNSTSGKLALNFLSARSYGTQPENAKSYLFDADGRPLPSFNKKLTFWGNTKAKLKEYKSDWQKKTSEQKIKFIISGIGLLTATGLAQTLYKKLLTESDSTFPFDNLEVAPEDTNYIQFGKASSILADKLGKLTNEGVTIISLYGEEGTGKSTLAKQQIKKYIVDVQAQPDNSNDKKNVGIIKTIFWFDASTVESLERGLYQLGKLLGIPASLLSDTDGLCQQIANELIFRPGWVIVFDQLSSYELVKNYIEVLKKPLLINKNQTLQGKIIITTQESIAAKIGEQNEIRVDGFTLEEAKAYINKFIQSENESQKAALAKKLAKLPLALKHACIYIKEKNSAIEKYLKDLKADLPPLLDRDYTSKEAKAIYKAIYSIASEGLGRDHIAYHLALFCSLCARSPIPESLLKHKLSFHMKKNDVDQELNGALHKLKQLGLVECFEIDNVAMVQMPWAAQVTLISKAGSISEILKDTIQFLLNYFPENNLLSHDIEKRSGLITHAEAIVLKAEKEQINFPFAKNIAHLKLGMSNFYSQTGMPNQCEKILLSSKKTLEACLPVAIINKNAQEICQYLAKQDPALPTQFANTLYQMCRSYFNNQETDMPKELEDALNLAITMRSEIDSNKEKYDDRGNTDGYTNIYLRHGKALSLLIKAENKGLHEALSLLNEAENILCNIYLKGDDFHKAFCYELLAKIALQKARYAESSEDKEKLLNNALSLMDGGKVSLSDTKSLEIQPGAMKIMEQKGANRLGKFYNLLGQIFYEKGQISLSAKYYHDCLNLEKQRIDFPMAEALYGLALINHFDNPNLAQRYIDKAVNIYVNNLHRSSKHPKVKNALDLQELISKLNEKKTVWVSFSP